MDGWLDALPWLTGGLVLAAALVVLRRPVEWLLDAALRTGVGLAVLIGFPVGMAMGFSPFIMRTLAPYINAVRQIPITAWVPMAIIWFGLGDGPTIFIITFSTVFVVILNVVAAVQDISPDYYNAVRSMGAGQKDVLLDVVLPGCSSGLVTGVRMALGGAWMTVM